ncbi:MAG: hypothetical protein PWR07_2190 [Bacillota bacterium]|nr:hypothetical protein [Bacillota bacterium]MDK2932059.1 hypothetical protein [Bacillota bacterium]
MGLAWMLRCAAILSLVIILEMAWVIYAHRSQVLSRQVISVAVGVVAATAVLYVSLLSFIAVRVMAPLIYGL